MTELQDFAYFTAADSNTASKSSGTNLLREGAYSALYSGVQEPVSGVSELIDQVTGTNILPSVQFMEAPTPASFGSAKWHAQQVGGAIGMIAPFMVARSGAKSMLSSPVLGTELTGGARLAIAEGAASGFIFDSVFRPVHSTGSDFWTDRLKHGVTGAATFGTLSAGTIGLNTYGRTLAAESISGSILKSNITKSALSGIPAGLVNAQTSAILDGRTATLREMGESAYTMAFVGGALGALHSVPGQNRFFGGGSPPNRPGTLSEPGLQSHRLGRNENSRPTLSSRITEKVRSGLEQVDSALASVNPFLLNSGPRLAFATAGDAGPTRMSMRPSPLSIEPLQMSSVNVLEGRGQARGQGSGPLERKTERPAEKLKDYRFEGEVTTAHKLARQHQLEEVADFIKHNPELRNIKVSATELGHGFDTPLVMEIVPSKQFPNGAVMKISMPDGGWDYSWGKRSFDAEILTNKKGEPHFYEVDFNGNGLAQVYIQELVEVSTRPDPILLERFLTKVAKEGLSFEDPGALQLGRSQKTGELVLIDYPSVDTLNSWRTHKEIVEGADFIEREIEAENRGERPAEKGYDQEFDGQRERQAQEAKDSGKITETQQEILSQLRDGIPASEIAEYIALIQGKTLPNGMPDTKAIMPDIKKMQEFYRSEGR